MRANSNSTDTNYFDQSIRPRSPWAAAVALTLALLSPTAATRGECEQNWKSGAAYSLPGLDGPVNAMTTWDPDGAGPQPPLLIAAGSFSRAGTSAANRIAAWNGSEWQPLGSGLNNSVRALTVYNGMLVAGGDFTTAGGSQALRVATWNGSNWIPFATGLTLTVRALTVFNGQLIAGGDFETNIVRWTGTNWQSLGQGMNNAVYALTVYNGELIAGGTFTRAGQALANCVATWNGSWRAMGTGVNNFGAFCFATYGGELIVGGGFDHAGGISANAIARWNGFAWSSLGEPVNGVLGSVYSLNVHNGELIVGGGFDAAGGESLSPAVAKWNGNNWLALGTGTNYNVLATAEYGGRLITAGQFARAGGVLASNIASWSGGTARALGSGVNTPVAALTVHNGELYEGGVPSSAGYPASRVARLHGDFWETLGIGMYNANAVESRIAALAAFQGTPIAGGTFDYADRNLVNNIAAWNGAGWEALAGGMTGGGRTVSALAIYHDELIAAGSFTTAGSASVANIARWNGTAWQDLGGGISGQVNCLAVLNDELIAAGSFSFAGSVPANSIAKWTGSAWQALGSGFNGVVYSLTIHNGELIAGGSFVTSGSAQLNCVGRWDGLVWQPLGAGLGGPGVPTIKALASHCGGLFAGGNFLTADGLPANRAARWNGANWLPLGNGANSDVAALTIFGDQVVFGGSFTSVGGSQSYYWNRWGPVLPTISQQPVSFGVEPGGSATFTVAADETATAFQWRRNNVALADGGNISGATTPTLTIAPAAATDAGRYDVTVSNECGTTTSSAVRLSVLNRIPTLGGDPIQVTPIPGK